MVSIQQFKQGLLHYIDTEIVDKTQGLAKWGIAISGGLLVEQYLSDPSIFGKLGCMTQDGMIDIDKFHDIVKDVADKKGKVTQNLPMVGPVTFSSDDVTKAYLCIKGEL